ncbi:MAG: hypothetical protein U5K77_03085 [Candidatus Saccharibacteria bacterium]|nr:hypothetical protein [Candidatus Saccharibacteria bacterium]
MELYQLILIIGSILASTLAFLWVVFKINGSGKTQQGTGVLTGKAQEDVEHIFNDEFREELRNRGRLHFEKIIGENAMFLQQDLRLTTSQLNEFMKTEITRKLQDEFAKYEESITDAKQLAIDSINKTQEAVEQQRQLMGQQLQKELADERQRLIKRFENDMTDIINHYVLAAIGDQIDLNDQLEFILSDLEANKDAIIRDLSGNG